MLKKIRKLALFTGPYMIARKLYDVSDKFLSRKILILSREF